MLNEVLSWLIAFMQAFTVSGGINTAWNAL